MFRYLLQSICRCYVRLQFGLHLRQLTAVLKVSCRRHVVKPSTSQLMTPFPHCDIMKCRQHVGTTCLTRRRHVISSVILAPKADIFQTTLPAKQMTTNFLTSNLRYGNNVLNHSQDNERNMAIQFDKVRRKFEESSEEMEELIWTMDINHNETSMDFTSYCWHTSLAPPNGKETEPDDQAVAIVKPKGQGPPTMERDGEIVTPIKGRMR